MILCLLVWTCIMGTYAQEDLESLLEQEMEEITIPVTGAFYSTHLINGHSLSLLPEKGLDFRVSHRFGEIRSGFNDFYGIDESSSYFSLEYGITPRLMTGLGRATYGNTFNGFFKYWLVRQKEGGRPFPFSVVWHSAAALNSTIYTDRERYRDFASRLDYTHQLIAGSKITPALSMQVMPGWVHRNLTRHPDEPNDVFFIGMGGRYKLTNSVSVNAEYYWVMNKTKVFDQHDPVALGVDIQVSGHVFQLHLTNASDMTENAFLAETTTGDFFDFDMRLGFNITQVFTIGRSKSKPDESLVL